MGALEFPEGDVFTLTFSVNGELLLAGGGQQGHSAAAVLWEVRTAKRVGEFESGFDTILAAEISPDHRIVVLGGPDRRVRAFDTATGTQLYELDKHTDWIFATKITPDGELLATADRAGNLLLWQAANGRFVEALRGHEGAIHDLSYTLDSNVLASAGADGQVILWDTWKYSQIRRIKAHGTPVLSVHFSPDGSVVSSARDGETKQWALDGKEQRAYERLSDWAYQTTFGAKGGVVVTGDWSGELAVWKSEDGARLATLTTNPAPEVSEAKVAANTGGAGAAAAR
jgi:WD40 repeat protein